MYGNTNAGVGVGRVLLSDSFMFVQLLCSENVYTAHSIKKLVVT